MTPTNLYFKCGECGQTDRVHVTSATSRLAKLGMLRRATEAEPELVFELFAAALDRIPCLACGQPRLQPCRASSRDFDGGEFDEGANWPAARPCVDCGAIIAAERLELLPSTDRCTTCQERDDLAKVPSSDEFCPRCGDRLQMRAGGAGITRYRWYCPTCRR